MDDTDKNREERKYSLRDISIVFVTCIIFVLIFDAGGLDRWAKGLEIGSKSRNFFVAITDPLNSFTSNLKLDYPGIILQESFLLLAGKEREAGFLAAKDSPCEGFPMEEPQAVVSTGMTEPIPEGIGSWLYSPNCGIENRELFDEIYSDTENVFYSSSNPLKVLVIGDSMMADGFGTMIMRTLEEDDSTVPTRYFKVSSGLSRPDFYNWPAQAAQIFSEGDYDAIIIMMGTNDAQGFEMDGQVYDYGTDKWIDIYRGRVIAFINYLCWKTRHVYWVGLPPMRMSGYNKRMQDLNELIEQVCGYHPRASYISTVPILGDADGKYSTYLTINGRQIQVRGSDGIHVTRSGGQLIVDRMLEFLKEDFVFGEE